VAKKQNEPGLIKARVLVACSLGRPNDVIELSVSDIAAHAGEVDTNPAAVEYAESLKK
jgi:hypothetical protein